MKIIGKIRINKNNLKNGGLNERNHKNNQGKKGCKGI